ncbi:sulfurtransferase TusA family protein [Alkaliphilus serpentinus]|uniref:Preprotein translocase subunit TatB n=1 Tax=Alkaliphilus serpentinus TaxID=1482731 RepID=A0A833HN83_9FIRM|nr:sulfurtransferase TusA family protein [Alkaliphilus serpentinus]KAB3529162.1 preprotein translocase subunit TatB [Alkaliphilus serpentinus]
MSDKIIDARGRSCPEPVIMTKNALENVGDGTVKVMVDATVAVENIKRFAVNSGFNVKVNENEEDFILTIRR